jgi:type I restriction enzyme S subunit
MDSWKLVELGSLGAGVSGGFAAGPFGSAVSSKNFTDSGTPMLRGSNLSTDIGIRLEDSDMVFVPEELSDRFSRCIVGAGDLVFTCWGTVGQVGLVDSRSTYDRYLISNKQMKMTPDPELADPVFLYYCMSQPVMVKNIQGQAIGSSVPGFNLGQLKSLKILLPDLLEQRAIAEVLGALDDKIAVNRRVAECAEALMIAHASALGKSTEVGRVATRVTHSVNPDSFQETVLHYSLPAFDEGKLPVIGSSSSIKSNKFLLADPCVLFSKLNPRIPRIWNLVELGDSQVLASTEFVVLKPAACSTSVLWALLSQPAVIADISSKVAGTTGSHQRVSPSEILATAVGDPRELDNEVAELIDNLGRLSYFVRVESRILANTRDELLPLLMSGKLRVKDVEKKVEAIV